MLKVAVLGLGNMGAAMAQNLLKAGFPLTVYNRTQSKADLLATHGAQVASTPRTAAAGAEVVIAMVGDDSASRAIWLGANGALAAAEPETVLIECSTLSIDWVRELAGLAAARGLAFLDSPVAGSVDAAQSGTLKMMVGGDAAPLERVRPVLAALSSQIVHFGAS